MGDTTIQWTDKTWNPVTGCTKVSQGCKNCYAERVFPRAYGKVREFTDVQCHPERLDQPLRWKKPQRIFVNSMSDLFHESIPDEFIDSVFDTMYKTPRHTFQVLTKRPQRMLEFLKHHFGSFKWKGQLVPAWLSNVWLGVSVEDQPTADERIPLLLQTPAAVRFLSCEPLLGSLDITAIRRTHADGFMRPLDGRFRKLDWIICGGESGPHARPMQEEWARSLMQQCKAAGVPFFMKQGSKANWPDYSNFESFPRDLRVREFPASSATTGGGK